MRKSVFPETPKKYFIRYSATMILLLLISFGSCKKDKPDQPVPNKIRQELTIAEPNSNLPVKEATVLASFCSPFVCGYPDSAVTNDSGKVIFLTIDGVNTFQVHADKYWPAFYQFWPYFKTADSHNLELVPVAALKVHIIKADQYQYPVGSLLKLSNAYNGPNGCNGCGSNLRELALTQDRIIYMKGAGGGTSNYLQWYVDSGQQIVPNPWNVTPSVVINRSDTAEFLIEY